MGLNTSGVPALSDYVLFCGGAEPPRSGQRQERTMRLWKILTAAVLVTAFGAGGAVAEEIGSVNTEWKMIGPDNKIVVEAFDDPDIANISCWLSRPKKGGLSGAVGLTEDLAFASIACRQRGPVTIPDDLRKEMIEENDDGGQRVFKKRLSPIFKTMQVSRMYDAERNTLIYLIWSDKVLDGSYKNAISVVAIAPWGAGS